MAESSIKIEMDERVVKVIADFNKACNDFMAALIIAGKTLQEYQAAQQAAQADRAGTQAESSQKSQTRPAT